MSERTSRRLSPQSEPIQKPKLTMNTDVRAAISAKRSYSAGRRFETKYVASASTLNSTIVTAGS